MHQPSIRRSNRIEEDISITLIGSDTEGRSFLEHTRTILISRHGAGIVSRYKLSPEQELLIRLQDSDKETDVRVIGQIGVQLPFVRNREARAFRRSSRRRNNRSAAHDSVLPSCVQAGPDHELHKWEAAMEKHLSILGYWLGTASKGTKAHNRTQSAGIPLPGKPPHRRKSAVFLPGWRQARWSLPTSGLLARNSFRVARHPSGISIATCGLFRTSLLGSKGTSPIDAR